MAAGVFLFLFPGMAAAQGTSPEPISTDRPDQTEAPAVVGRGVFQVESGWSVARTPAGNTVHSLPQTLVRVGVSSRFEFRGEFEGWQRASEQNGRSSSGTGDIALGFKYQFTKSPRRESAVLADLGLPTGTDGFGAGTMTQSIRYTASQTWSDRIGTGYNVGISGNTRGGALRLTELLGTSTIGFDLTPKVGLFAELFGFVRLGDDGLSRSSLDAGLTFRPQPNLQIDVSGGVGLSGGAETWFAGGGLSIRLPR